MSRLLKRIRNSLRPVSSVDAFAAGRLVGWAASKRPVAVGARDNGDTVASYKPGGNRPDVATAHPRLQDAAASGFVLDLPANVVKGGGIYWVEVLAKREGFFAMPATLASFNVANESCSRSELLSSVDSSRCVSTHDVALPQHNLGFCEQRWNSLHYERFRFDDDLRSKLLKVGEERS